MNASHTGRQAGFAYLGVLFFVVLCGVWLAAVSQVWHAAAKREREAELLFIGDQFRAAIARYAAASQPAQQKYPATLEDLLEDKRLPVVVRHLRRLYVDPMTGKADWEVVVVPGQGIVAVHSRSAERPLKEANFPLEYNQFASATRYSEWVFGDPVDKAAANKQVGSEEQRQQQQVVATATDSTVVAATEQGPPVSVEACEAQHRSQMSQCLQWARRQMPMAQGCESRAEEALAACMQRVR